MKVGSGRFRRVVEDFRCYNCGFGVKGTGYTDHCPACLWGLHVDNNPGDRASRCKGKLKPTGVVYESGAYVISYQCLRCGANKRFKASDKDSSELLSSMIKLAD